MTANGTAVLSSIRTILGEVLAFVTSRDPSSTVPEAKSHVGPSTGNTGREMGETVGVFW